jgi:hypothetical protein
MILTFGMEQNNFKILNASECKIFFKTFKVMAALINTKMQVFPLSLPSKPSLMKIFFTSLTVIFIAALGWSQGVVGTSPLEYNTDKFYQFNQSPIQAMETRSLYPSCGTNFYLYDTLSLPFIDDFSQNHFTTYNSWDWPTAIDSIAKVYKLTPDTFAADTQLFKYSLTPTKHYTFAFDTVNSIDSSIVNIARQLIIYGDCSNPFLPTDTFNVWAITSPKYYWDTLTLTVQSIVNFPDGTLNGDTIDTIQVYFPQPNKSYWIDNFAYRNNTMGIDPPTYGVVTFDGTNEFGEPYSPGGTSSYGIADYLTSKPINMGGLTAGDNVFLSFFCQPKGLGYRPDAGDSLVVEFYSPLTQKWHHQWSEIGDTLIGENCRPFLQYVLPVSNSIFLQNGFQFRFKNWGNLSGNLDHWNIDYVRLDTNRNVNDTLIQDVAFVFLPNTILNKYTSMPFNQFTLADKKLKWNNFLSNLFNSDKTITYGFDFRNESGTLLNQWPTDYPAPDVTDIITPYDPNGYSNFAGWAEPDFNYTFSGSPALPFTDTARFTIGHYFNCTTTDVNAENDSIILKQDFINYYSYDDGTAEQSIWLGTPGYMQVKFTNNFADTLRALQIYYSPIKEDVTSRYITLQVYQGDLSNPPIYQVSKQIGVLDADPNGLVNPINNGFTTYLFSDTIIPLPAGDFFVGWYQNQTFKINVGFDKNIDNKNKTYYRTSRVWDTLSIPGTLMIRPVVGRPLVKEQIGIEEYWNDESIQLYPNPANEIIFYSINQEVDLSAIRIIDVTGKLVYHSTQIQSNQVDISNFAKGLYFMQFISEESALPVTKKFIVAR